MTKKDILIEIDFYEKRLIEDPEGKNLYNAMLDSLKIMLEKKEKKNG